jgi:hypothetical protein
MDRNKTVLANSPHTLWGNTQFLAGENQVSVAEIVIGCNRPPRLRRDF